MRSSRASVGDRLVGGVETNSAKEGPAFSRSWRDAGRRREGAVSVADGSGAAVAKGRVV